MDFINVFLGPLVHVVLLALQIYYWIVIARAVISWVNPDPYNPIVRFLYTATDPVLYRIRRVLPVSWGGIDLSPIVLIFALVFLEQMIMNLYRYLQVHM